MEYNAENKAELTNKQHEIYMLIDKKIDIENIQSQLRNNGEYLHEFSLILEILDDKRILESSVEDELVQLLTKSVNFILEKELQKIDQDFLKTINF